MGIIRNKESNLQFYFGGIIFTIEMAFNGLFLYIGFSLQPHLCNMLVISLLVTFFFVSCEHVGFQNPKANCPTSSGIYFITSQDQSNRESCETCLIKH